MERPCPRPEPAAIDITWVSCRGVRSSLPFHTPCLYASVSVTPSSSAKNAHGHRRPHRVKTPTDRAGGENPEWDAPLRLYLPEPEASPTAAELELEPEAGKNRGDGVLLVRFELKAEVAVLGDVLAASAVVPVPDLVADGRTRRVSYQLAGPDGRQPNGVISFSYAFHQRNADAAADDHHHHHQSGGDAKLLVAPPCPTSTVSSPVAQPPPTTAAPRLYPAIEWPLTEEIPIYHTPLLPVPAGAAAVTLANSRYYPPPPSSAAPVQMEPVAVYPPPLPETSSCNVYPSVLPASAMYPPVDLAPVSCYPPASTWNDRCLYG